MPSARGTACRPQANARLGVRTHPGVGSVARTSTETPRPPRSGGSSPARPDRASTSLVCAPVASTTCAAGDQPGGARVHTGGVHRHRVVGHHLDVLEPRVAARNASSSAPLSREASSGSSTAPTGSNPASGRRPGTAAGSTSSTPPPCLAGRGADRLEAGEVGGAARHHVDPGRGGDRQLLQPRLPAVEPLPAGADLDLDGAGVLVRGDLAVDRQHRAGRGAWPCGGRSRSPRRRGARPGPAAVRWRPRRCPEPTTATSAVTAPGSARRRAARRCARTRR